MSIPQELKYTKDHEWVKVTGDEATVGITDFAQGELGDIVYVEVETVGDTLDQEAIFGTIEAVKTCFKVWIFQKTSSLAVRQVQKENPYTLLHKKLSSITKEDIKGLHNIIRIKSPAVANKVVKFLNVVFKYGVEVGELSKNPIKMKKKEWSPDKEDNRILTEDQRQILLSIVLTTDGRNGKINYTYYKEKGLNLVSCLIITWWL